MLKKPDKSSLQINIINSLPPSKKTNNYLNLHINWDAGGERRMVWRNNLRVHEERLCLYVRKKTANHSNTYNISAQIICLKALNKQLAT
jgi:hypothetical protein